MVGFTGSSDVGYDGRGHSRGPAAIPIGTVLFFRAHWDARRLFGETPFWNDMELDRFDRQLLNLVQQDSAQTAEQLAETVGLSPSAIQRRLKRMREQGVIVRDAAIVDPRAIGRPTFFVVSLEIERERPELLAQLREWLANRAEVQQAFYVTGETDFVIVVTARDTEAFDAMMSQLVKENPNVRRFTTNVVLNLLKQGLTIPVPLDE